MTRQLGCEMAAAPLARENALDAVRIRAKRRA